MQINEAVTNIGDGGLLRQDGGRIEAYRNDNGNIVVTGGPFNRVKRELDANGTLTPEDAEMVTAWYEGEGGEEGDASGAPVISPEEQEMLEATAAIDAMFPGQGVGGMMQWMLTNIPGMTHKKLFGMTAQSGSLAFRMLSDAESRNPIAVEMDLTDRKIEDARDSNVDIAGSMKNLVFLHKVMNDIRRAGGTIDPNMLANKLRLMGNMIHVKKIHGTTKLFVRSVADPAHHYGTCLNLSPMHPLSMAADQVVRDIQKMEKDLRDRGIISEDEPEFIREAEFPNATRGGGNVSACIKDISEIGEEIIDMYERGDRPGAIKATMRLVEKWADTFEYAMSLDEGVLDEASEELREVMGMVADKPEDFRKGVTKLLGSFLKRRREFHQMMKPDKVVRVGSGATELGDKPDALYLYNEKPTDWRAEYAYKDKETGMWAIGVSLKTYRNTGATKSGEVNGMALATAYILDPKNDHMNSVYDQCGFNTKDAREVKEAARGVNQMAEFCKGLQTMTELRGLDFTQSSKVVAEQIFKTMESQGIQVPKGMTQDEVIKALDTARGENQTQQEYITKLSVHLEKEMNLKMLSAAQRPDGTLDPDHPMTKLQLALYAQAGLDTKTGAPVLNSTTFMDTDESKHYNANERITQAVKDARAGRLPMRVSRGGISIGDCESLKYSSDRNRNIVQGYHSNKC
jgi:hypothetical protein